MIVENKQNVANNGEVDLIADADPSPEQEPADLAGGVVHEDAPLLLSECSERAALEAILESLTEVKTTLALQGKAVAEFGHRDALFGQLHERLAAYEQDERSRSFLEPLARKAAPLHRRLREQAGHARRALESLPQPLREASPYYWACRSLEATRAELETLLADFGIETFIASGCAFDRRCQEAIERVAVRGSHKTGEIARRIAPGLRIDGRVVVAERVAVYVAQVSRQS